MSESIFDKIKDDVVPALFSAGLSLAGYSLVFGESITTPYSFFGMTLPSGVVVGGGVFLSDVAGEVLQNNLLSLLPQSQTMANLEGRLAKPLISGLTLYGLYKFGVSNDTQFLPTFGLAAGSTLAGSYIYDGFSSGTGSK